MPWAGHVAVIGLLLGVLQGPGPVGRPADPPIEPGETGRSVPGEFRDSAPSVIGGDLPRYIASWTRATPQGAMALPVFDGTVAVGAGGIAVLGGFTGRLQTTKAIQVLDPRRGWQPIGSQLLEPRAGHTMTPLGDGRVLIVGGVQGTLGGEMTILSSCEVLDPFIAGSREAPPIDAPMFGHTAHALADGRVAIIGGDAVRIFDASRSEWTDRIPLARPREGHVSVLLGNGRILVIGGDSAGSIEEVDPLADPTADARTDCWLATLRLPVSQASAILLPDGRVLVVGGLDVATGATGDRTWFLDPAQKSVTEGPSLQIEAGVARAALFLERGKVVIAGGEWISGDQRSPVAASRLYDPIADRLWSLAEFPSPQSHMAWFRDRLGRLTGWGGYRFVSEAEVPSLGLPAGVHLSDEAWFLRVGEIAPPVD